VSYATPGSRRTPVRQLCDRLRASRTAVLTTHVNADGDGTGCEAAVASWLRANGTEAWIVNPTPYPDAFRFLLENEDWVLPAGGRRAREVCGRADLAVVLDTGEVPRIGRVRSLIRDVPTVVIDHHPQGDRPIGGLSLRDPDACATGELVYDLILQAKGPWPAAAVRGLYVAILTDTGGFRFSNSTDRCHEVVADLIRRGADPEELHGRVYGASPMRKYRIMEKALATLENDEEYGLAWMTIPRDMYDRLGATPDDLEGMVDIPRGVEGVNVGLLFRTTTEGEVKVSFRSNGAVDVNEVARKFDGGGHVRASGAMLPGPLDEAIPKVIEATREAVRDTLFPGGVKA